MTTTNLPIRRFAIESVFPNETHEKHGVQLISVILNHPPGRLDIQDAVQSYDRICKSDLKNLIAKSTSRGKQSYSISDPDHLIQTLEEKKRSTDDLLNKAKAYQTELKAAYSRQYKKPLVTYVDGLDGIKQLYIDSLNCQDKQEGIRSYTSIRDLAEGLGDYADKYYTERTRRGIPIRGIVPDTEPGKENKRVQDKFLRQVRLIPRDKFDFSPEIYLYDDKLSVMSLKDNFGFVLQSKEIVDALKIAWQLAWERAGEYDKQLTA